MGFVGGLLGWVAILFDWLGRVGCRFGVCFRCLKLILVVCGHYVCCVWLRLLIFCILRVGWVVMNVYFVC